MREVLDRLREAETALDKQLIEIYYTQNSAIRTRRLDLLWQAKWRVWYASMDVLFAAAGGAPNNPT